jgi:hypothetical protein
MPEFGIAVEDWLSDPVLCILIAAGGTVHAVISVRHGELGYRHAEYHAARGFERA